MVASVFSGYRLTFYLARLKVDFYTGWSVPELLLAKPFTNWFYKVAPILRRTSELFSVSEALLRNRSPHQAAFLQKEMGARTEGELRGADSLGFDGDGALGRDGETEPLGKKMQDWKKAERREVP